MECSPESLEFFAPLLLLNEKFSNFFHAPMSAKLKCSIWPTEFLFYVKAFEKKLGKRARTLNEIQSQEALVR